MGATVAALGIAGTLVAEADWMIGGSAEVRARTAGMPRGVKPSVAKQSKAAVVSWSAQEIAPGIRMDHYVVTAHSVDVPMLPSISRAVAATGKATESVVFGADEVAGGRWYWTIVPRFALWTGAEGGRSTKLNFPAPTKAAQAVAEVARAAPTATPAAPVPTASTEAAVVSGTAPAAVSRSSPTAGPTPGDSPPSTSGTTPSEQPPKPVEPSASDSAPADIPE
ncbi:hypothetical protein ACGFJ7_04420 [Actinoplanes sp. NPDC048988]|uniref:hypothetical protein n=1 Tax=Actinoplanes sp. NPDC048988 TaxID=3363901 RepID=UPI00372193EF